MKTAHKTLKMEPELVEQILKWCEKHERSFNWFMADAAKRQIARESADERPTSSHAPAVATAVESGGNNKPQPGRKCRDGKHCHLPKAVNS